MHFNLGSIVSYLFTEHDVARGILKVLGKIWEFRATSYSVNSQGIIVTCILLMKRLLQFYDAFAVSMVKRRLYYN